MIDQLRKLLAEIKEREAAATPGPWTIDYGVSARSAWAISGPRTSPEVIRLNGSENVDLDEQSGKVEENLEFIAAARTDIPRLVQALEALLVHFAGQDPYLCGSEYEALADALAALKGEGK